MSDGTGAKGGPPPPPGAGSPPSSAGAKRRAVGLQLRLPCGSLDDVRSRYGEELRQGRFFLRTQQPRPIETLVRLEAQLRDGTPCFRAAGVVSEVHEPPATDAAPGAPEPGMGIKLLAADEAGRELIASLGGRPPLLLKPQEPARMPVPSGLASTAIATPSAIAKPTATARPSPTPKPTPSATAKPAAPPRPPAPPSSRPAPPPPTMAPGQVAQKPAPEPTLAQPSSPPKTAGKKGPMIGIDLGTTNSCAAVVRDKKPFVIPSREGYSTIPSVVALSDKGKLMVGHPAKGQLLINPTNTVYGAKRLVGRQFNSPVVMDLVGRFPYQIVAGEKGEAAVKLGDQVYSLQRISSLVLAEVKEIARQWLKSEITRAIITVPAYYNDNQRQAVREAGALAGLQVERILNEPTAAALAFAHGRELHERVLVYDLGGGTFDASVLELQGNVYEVLSTGGDTFLGGVDFDKKIVDHLLATFKEEHRIDFPGDRVALQRITDAAERAKIALSEQLETQIHVPFVGLVADRPFDLKETLTRAQLVQLTGHLVDRTLEVCGEVLSARGLKTTEISDVLLVGGQSRMPLVRERIRNFFGREPSRAVHPDEAVALGAALLADSIESGAIQGVVLIDVLPMSIGVGLPGGRFKKIIERNTSLPNKRAYTISTTRDGQDALEIAVFQGEGALAHENEYLGTLIVPDIPKGPRGTVSFDVMFSLSVEALLTATAEERGTGRSVTATFSTKDTPEAVRKKLVAQGIATPPATAPARPDGEAAAGGLFGWVRRLFGGRGPEPRV